MVSTAIFRLVCAQSIKFFVISLLETNVLYVLPPRAAAGGTAVGAGAGGVGAGVGAGVGRAVQIQRVFTITARDVFQHLPGFREDKEQKLVYCQIRNSHSWEEMAYSIEQSQNGAD